MRNNGRNNDTNPKQRAYFFKISTFDHSIRYGGEGAHFIMIHSRRVVWIKLLLLIDKLYLLLSDSRESDNTTVLYCQISMTTICLESSLEAKVKIIQASEQGLSQR